MATKIALGLAHESGVVLDPEPVERALEEMARYWCPGQADLNARSHVGTQDPEAVDHGVVDGQECRGAKADLGHMGPGLSI